MSMQMAVDLQKIIRDLPGNKYCADCGTLNPQWASVSHGSLVCLNCSGQHRSLGVHLSFVRSVTMDSWSEKQIRAMRAGGNKKMNDFFTSQGVPANLGRTDIRAKYDNDVAEYFRELIEAERDLTAKPTRAIPTYKQPSAGGGASGGGDDFEGLSAEERFARHKQLEEAARERMRAKFGKSGGLGSGSFGSAGIGSDPNYRPGGNSGGGGGSVSGAGSNAASEWFASAAKVTSQWTAKVGEDVKKAKVADKLKSGWSWFTQSATAVIDKAKANIAKDNAPKLYSRDDSPRAGTPPRLYNPDAARHVDHAHTEKPMEGFGSSKTGTPQHAGSGGGGGGGGRLAGKKLQGFGSSSVTATTTGSAAPTKAKSNSIGWDDDLFDDDLDMGDEAGSGAAVPAASSGSGSGTGRDIAALDDSELLGDIDSVLGNAAGEGAAAPAPVLPPPMAATGANSPGAKTETVPAGNDDDDDDFFKEFGM